MCCAQMYIYKGPWEVEDVLGFAQHGYREQVCGVVLYVFEFSDTSRERAQAGTMKRISI